METTKDYKDPNVEKLRRLIYSMGTTVIIANRLDYYGNTIPLGAFCNAISFILYGFHRSNVFKSKDSFLLGIIFLFGGLGQTTAGILEFLKGRSFSTMVYLTYGFYCLSHYFLYMMPLQFYRFGVLGINFDEASLSAFYGCWMLISLIITIASIRINLFFVLQCLASTIFFALRCFGEGFARYGLMRESAGILQIIAGFFSLYICINQLLNEHFRKQVIPSFAFNQDNEIDIPKEINEKKE